MLQVVRGQRTLKSVLSFVLVGLALGCGAAPGGSAAAGSSSESLVVVTPLPSKLPFDPRSVRLRRASDKLAEIAGHPVAFHLDAAVVPEWRSSFEEELVRAFEHVAQDLEALRDHDERAFARAAPALLRIDRKYDATARQLDVKFDFAQKRVEIRGAPEAGLVDRGSVGYAIRKEYDGYIAGATKDKDAEGVAPGERRAYFESLVRTRPGYGWLVPATELVPRVVALARVVGDSDPKLAEDIRAWLVERLRDVESEHNVMEAASEPADSPRRRAHVAYGAWLSSAVSRLNDEQKEAVVRSVFAGRAACRSFEVCNEKAVAYPGFDSFAFGLSLVDEWIRLGHPATGEGPHFSLVYSVVCPHEIDARGRREQRIGCSAIFYRDAVLFERARLAQAILARNDAAWTTEVFTNLEHAKADDVIALWRALEPNRAMYDVATRTLVEETWRHGHRAELEKEAYRLWKDAPAHRGAALFVLGAARVGYDLHYADSFWAEFVKITGATVSEAELGAMLALDPRAVTFLPLMWKALAPGPHMATIAGPLRAWLSQVKPNDEGEPGKTVRALFGRVCESNTSADVQALQAVYRSFDRPGADPAITNLSGARCPTVSSSGSSGASRR